MAAVRTPLLGIGGITVKFFVTDVGVVALGEGWGDIDDNAPLINTSPGADLLWEAFGCHARASAAINPWTFL